MSRCNYCKFEELKQEAESEGKKLEIRDDDWTPGAKSVFVDGVERVTYLKLGKRCEC